MIKGLFWSDGVFVRLNIAAGCTSCAGGIAVGPRVNWTVELWLPSLPYYERPNWDSILALVAQADLEDCRRETMFRLLARHFEGVTREQFAGDLAEKNLALLLQRGDRLVGFSTLAAYTSKCGGASVNVIYSGDTIVSPESWGTTSLPRAWVAGVETLRAKLPPGKCYWLLLTSGFRTYRFLPVFWRKFFPRFDMPTPLDAQNLLNQLATERFGEQYEPNSGIVRFTHPQRLCHKLSEVPDGRKNDLHTAFFFARNPGHVRGDELVCLTELCSENLTAAGRRMMLPRIHERDRNHC